MTQAYPLHWPFGFPRTKSPGRSQFRTEASAALNNVGQPRHPLYVRSDQALERWP